MKSYFLISKIQPQISNPLSVMNGKFIARAQRGFTELRAR